MSYTGTFIEVAPDSRAEVAKIPQSRGGKKTVAVLEYEMISARPYVYTQEDVQFAVHVARAGIPALEVEAHRAELWADFFSKPMACMRTSPLPKSHGWGLHFDAEGKVALVAVETPLYERLARDPNLAHTAAMRSRRG